MNPISRLIFALATLLAFSALGAATAAAAGTTLHAPPEWSQRGKAGKQESKLEEKLEARKAKKAIEARKAKKLKKAKKTKKVEKAKKQKKATGDSEIRAKKNADRERKEKSNAARELTKEEREQIRAEEAPGFLGRMRRFFGLERSAERSGKDSVD